MPKPVISVIIPVYNVEAYLPQCLNSALAQTLKDIEIILVNDGSTDFSSAICESYAQEYENIRLINQSNQGLSAARNRGLEAAQGSYLAFVDSDDFIAADMLERLYKNIEESKADVAVCAYQRVDDLDTALSEPKGFSVGQISGREALEELFGPSYVYFTIACNKLFKASLFEDIRFPEGKIFEDGYAAFRYYHKAKKVFCSDHIGYFYRDRLGSISNSSQGSLGLDAVEANLDAYNFLREEGYYTLASKALAKYLACIFDKLRGLNLNHPQVKIRINEVHDDYRKLFPQLIKNPNLIFKEKALAATFFISPSFCKRLMKVRGL